MQKQQSIHLVLLTRRRGGAERVATQFAEMLGGRVYLYRRPDSKSAPARVVVTIVWLCAMTLTLAARTRCNGGPSVIIATHSKLNIVLGMLRRLGVLPQRASLVIRESTRIFERTQGIWKVMRCWLYRLAYPGATLVICQTALMARQLRDALGSRHAGNVVVVPNPVDIEAVRAQSLAFAGLEATISPPFIVAVGRLIPEKGFDLLLSAFVEVAESFSHSLVIVGDGPERETLKLQIARAGMQQRVVLTGHLANPFPVLRRADLSVLSSRIEGFPNVLLEYMLLCPRVVATRCADGLDELPGITLCAANDVHELAAAMSTALRLPASETVMSEYVSRERNLGVVGATLRGAVSRSHGLST